MSDNNYRDIQQFALNVRKDVAKILHRTRDSHIGGGYSSIDILSVLYTRVLDISPENLDDPNRNVFILSKGGFACCWNYAEGRRQGCGAAETIRNKYFSLQYAYDQAD